MRSEKGRAFAVAVVVAGALASSACSSSSGVGPSALPAFGDAAPRPAPVHVYIGWATGKGILADVPDVVANAAIDRLEAAARGQLVVHRQQLGTPRVDIYVDDAATQGQGYRGLAWRDAPCAGHIAMDSSALGDHFILLHELGHIFITGRHSARSEDVMAPGSTFRAGKLPMEFSQIESTVLQTNLATRCALTAEAEFTATARDNKPGAAPLVRE